METEYSNLLSEVPSTSFFEDQFAYKTISTEFGQFHVAFDPILLTKQCRSKPVILTMHDVGFNHQTNFDQLFSHEKMHSILKHFFLIHVNAPGQEMYSKTISFKEGIGQPNYPTLDQIAESLTQILQHLDVNDFVGFGVGIGANILTRFALNHPTFTNGLFLLDCTFKPAKMMETLIGYGMVKMLRNEGKMTNILRKFALGKHPKTTSLQEDNFQSVKSFNAHNLSLFLHSCLSRNKLNLNRTNSKQNISCPTLLITGRKSPKMNDSIQMASKLLPINSSIICIDGCVHVLSERANAIADAFQLFLQGLGFIPHYRLMGIDGDIVVGGGGGT